MVPIYVLLFFCFPFNAGARCFRFFKKLQLPAVGSESYAFDSDNVGPYTGLSDGRIVKYQGLETGFVEFATTSANRSKELCDGTYGNDLNLTATCGRALGMEFYHKTGELYLVGAVYGLMVVGRGGGLATQLAGGRDGDNLTEILLSEERTGRLLKYDPKTTKLTMLLKGLAFAVGVAVSKDGSFGPKANTSEIFVELPGNPDNIKRTKTRDFWVAVNIQRLQPKPSCFALGQKISADGRILETVNFYAEYNATSVAEVQEHHGLMYLSSNTANFAGVYKVLECSEKPVQL
ncbi:protein STRICTOSIDINE SYNTHASE-LIKE 10 [Sesamum alatum]|uniref:Protein STRICTOSIDINE SYNTHASE-LIKE 10 n=1 Tax=Sesamum alatum TaxID=300844 RepID=A0AAE2CIU6_9LAMI|nr:protein STRICTOSIDINE SYNTHASE-LIKE 10 [Sesamum alatum]